MRFKPNLLNVIKTERKCVRVHSFSLPFSPSFSVSLHNIFDMAWFSKYTACSFVYVHHAYEIYVVAFKVDISRFWRFILALAVVQKHRTAKLCLRSCFIIKNMLTFYSFRVFVAMLRPPLCPPAFCYIYASIRFYSRS